MVCLYGNDKKPVSSEFLTTGLAMLPAMFFGSGNLVFPVSMGQMAGPQNFWGDGRAFYYRSVFAFLYFMFNADV